MKQRNDEGPAKRRIGAEIIEGLTECRDVLRSGEPVERRLTVHTVERKRLKPKPDDVRSNRKTP